MGQGDAFPCIIDLLGLTIAPFFFFNIRYVDSFHLSAVKNEVGFSPCYTTWISKKIFVDAKNSSLQVSLKSISAVGTIYIWFYRELALGDKLTICFNEFPTASFTDPVVRSL